MCLLRRKWFVVFTKLNFCFLSFFTQAMRNYFAMISVPLPMDKESSQQRLQSCANCTKELKSSPLALIQLVRISQFVVDL